MASNTESAGITKSTIELTPGEALYINRIRKKHTTKEEANDFGVSADAYRSWERLAYPAAPIVDVYPLEMHEICTILRRRSGKTKREVAKAIGVSRQWLHRLEAGEIKNIGLLTNYWNI